MKKKNILALVLVFLVIGIFIGIILLSSDPSRVQKPVNPGPGADDPEDPEDPKDPDHNYKWELKTGDSEYHWYEATCDDHKGLVKSGSKEAHKFTVDKEDEKNERCTTCGYKRPIPTKQDDLNVSFGDDGASIDGLADETEHIPDLVIPGTVTDPATGEEVTVVEVNKEAFRRDQSLTTLVILDGVKTIGAEAFSDCPKLKEITIPKTVEYIDSQAFKNCKSLEKIHVDSANPVYRELGYCLIRIEDKCIILGCKGSTIPNANFNAVTSIGNYAFFGSGIETLTIPDNITSIGREAFRECKSLKSITLPQNITRLEDYTFYECSTLTKINLPDGITSIEQSAFAGCSSLDNLALPSNLKTIGDSAFSGCEKLKTITLNVGLTGIGKSAFSGCTSLVSITLPKTIVGIGSSAFDKCTNLTTIIFAGTEDEWQKVTKRDGWKPEEVEVTFKPDEEDEGDADDSGNSGDNGDAGDNGDSGIENQD